MLPEDDHAYRSWIYSHPSGFVLNALKGQGGGEPILHRAMCDHIAPQAGQRWVIGECVKPCCTNRSTLEMWAHARYGRFPTPCTNCDP